MKLRKEDVYINLQGKSEEELTELYNLVRYNLWRDIDFRDNSSDTALFYNDGSFIGSSIKEYEILSLTEVTIQQLKEILQPEPTLQQQLEKAKAEVERLEKEIEDSKLKIGDWVFVKELNMFFKKSKLVSTYKNEVKVTSQQLITLLENECK